MRAVADGRRMMALARSFAFPRRAGSEGSRRIIEMLAGRLEELGLEVNTEDFSYDLRPVEGWLRLSLMAGTLLIVCSSWLTAEHPMWSLMLLSAGLSLGALLLGWSPWLERLYRQPGPIHSANVIGCRETAEARRRIVLMAHHDSKSQRLALPVRMGATLGAIIGAVGGVGLAATSLVLEEPPGPPWLATSVGVIGGGSLLALALMTSGNKSPGGVDNAGSLAIVLRVAEKFLQSGHDHDLVVLFTGAEEDHMVGAMRWLDRHAGELTARDTIVLNFDGAGSPGRAVLITRFGLGRRFAAELERLALATAGELGLPVRRIVMAPAVGIDAIPFFNRGIECLTLTSGSLGRATYSVHSAGDVADHLDEETMVRIADYAAEIVNRWASSGSEHANGSAPERARESGRSDE